MIKMEKLQKTYPTYYSLLIAQVLYQILLIIFLKEFIKVNINTDMMIKNVKHAELNTKIATFFLNTQTLNII